MQVRDRLAATAAFSLATLLLVPGAASAAGPLPETPSLPALPAAPSINVTPTGDGAVVEVGAGDRTLTVGAGPAGVSLNQGGRNASPPGTVAEPGLPVSAPRDRPGRTRSPAPTPGEPGILFGPSPSPSRSRGSSAAHAPALVRPGSTSAPGREAVSDHGSAPAREQSQLPPFFELVADIPTAVKAGVVALVLLALGLWGAWVRQRRRFDQNAFVDPVTGIANAPAFDGLLARELERARRYKRPLALLLLDVSDVRQGRLLAPLDQTLRNATAAIQGSLRQGDVIARLGSSRFAVICPEANAVSAETLARAIELRLEEMRLHVAIGTVERQPTDLDAGHLEARAEAAMNAPLEPDPEHSPRRALLKAA
jgi:diguanylate cyclase (GGDEF)-like protein